MNDSLGEAMKPDSCMKNGFWPQSKVLTSVVDQYKDDGVLCEEFARNAPYVGRRRHQPTESFCIAWDVHAGYFIAICPANDDPKSFWLARALTNPNVDSNHPNEIQIEYWHPTSRSKAFHQTYKGWDIKKSVQWEHESLEEPTWVSTDCLLTSWMSTIRETTQNARIKIPLVQIPIIKASIATFDYGEESDTRSTFLQ